MKFLALNKHAQQRHPTMLYNHESCLQALAMQQSNKGLALQVDTPADDAVWQQSHETSKCCVCYIVCDISCLPQASKCTSAVLHGKSSYYNVLRSHLMLCRPSSRQWRLLFWQVHH